MLPLLRMIGYRRQPLDSVPAAAAALLSTWTAMRHVFPRDVRWFVQRTGHAREPLYSAQPLERALIASSPKRPSEVVPGAPTHQARLVAARRAEDTALLLAGFSLSGPSMKPSPAGPGAEVELSLYAGWTDGLADASDLAESAMCALVQSLDLDSMRAFPGGSIEEPNLTRYVRVGWLTFFPRSLGPLPSVPPGFACKALGSHGWVLRACQAIPPADAPEYRDALAHLRHALGARALLDGPSFPPPAPEAPIAPPKVEVALPEIVIPLVPSYLRSPPPAAPAPSSAAVAAPPAPPMMTKPLSTETADIDLSKLVRTSLPFDPNAAAAPTHESPPLPRVSTETTELDLAAIFRVAGPFPPSSVAADKSLPDDLEKKELPGAASAAAPSTPDFGETEEFSLASLLKSRPPVPFDKQAAEPAKTTALPAVGPVLASPHGHGRWIRFNPQTGEPLATPFWEELPHPGKK